MTEYMEYTAGFLEDEVFIVSSGEHKAEITIFMDFEALSTFLETMSIIEGSRLQVHHGVLCKADVLPSDFKRQRPYIVMFDPDSINIEGIVIDPACLDTKDLAKEIEETVAFGTLQCDITSDADISNVFVLYGYQLPIQIGINFEEIDEEVIFTCKSVSDDIESIRERL